jgi:serine/threonine-protein kinase
MKWLGGLGGLLLLALVGWAVMQAVLKPQPTPAPSEAAIIPEAEMVLIPAGEFQMGSEDGKSDEKPLHTVYLDAFYIDVYEVTNVRYAECVSAGDCTLPYDTSSYKRSSYYGNTEYANYPVIYVDWSQARAYCRWRGGDLPSEAQWEKAARGGLEIPARPAVFRASAGLRPDPGVERIPNPSPERVYPWDGECTPEHANYADANIGATTAVGVFPAGASPYGALDMSGNVWEWCLTKSRDGYSTPADDGLEGNDARVLRGGAFYYNARSVRCACRIRFNPYYRYRNYGFRVVASPIIHDSGS